MFLKTPASEGTASFSPDGRWIAYTSDESGRFEVYVRPFQGSGGGKWQISTGGGAYSFWSRDGRELYFMTLDNHIMVADYTAKGRLVRSRQASCLVGDADPADASGSPRSRPGP